MNQEEVEDTVEYLLQHLEGEQDDYNRSRTKELVNRLRQEFLRRRRLTTNYISPTDTITVNARGDLVNCLGISIHKMPKTDHSEVFTDRDGELVLVSQPYKTSFMCFDKLRDEALAKKLGLTVELVDGFPSWHYPGRTQLIIWRKRPRKK